MKNVIKILTALATVAGAIYIIATYGEQIVTWAKKMWSCMPKCPNYEEEDEVVIEMTEEAPTAEEAPAEEPAAEEVAVEEPAEEPAPEVVVAENEPVAEEADFAE